MSSSWFVRVLSTCRRICVRVNFRRMALGSVKSASPDAEKAVSSACGDALLE